MCSSDLLQNPGPGAPCDADVSETPASCTLDLPAGAWQARWFDPRTGQWHDVSDHFSGGRPESFSVPFNGDAVLLLDALGKTTN